MKQSILKLLILLFLLIAAFAAWRIFGFQQLTPARIRSFILSFGRWAPFLYIFLYTVRPLILFPAVLLTLAGGLAFGPWPGTLYVVTGASLGAYLAFWVARKLGRDIVERWMGKRLQMLDDNAAEHGFRTVLILRLIPLLPFDAVDYGAGLSKIRFRDYAPATTLGMIPAAFAYNFLGHSLNELFSPTFYLAVGLVLLLLLSPGLYKWVKKLTAKKQL